MTGKYKEDPNSGVNGYNLIAYGWPLANFGVILVDLNVVPPNTFRCVVGFDVRDWWVPTLEPGPQTPYSIRFDPAQRYAPIFPMVGQSLMNGAFWGLVLWSLFRGPSAWREWRSRKTLRPCPHCGYDLAATTKGKPCPECGHV